MHKSSNRIFYILIIFIFATIVTVIYGSNDKATSNSKTYSSTEQHLANKYGLEKPSKINEINRKTKNLLSGDFGVSFVVDSGKLICSVWVLIGLMLVLYIINRFRIGRRKE